MRILFSILVILACSPSIRGQLPGVRDPTASIAIQSTLDLSRRVTISIGVRDSRGLPLEDQAKVSLFSKSRGFSKTIPAAQDSTANFSDVLQGDYDVEVQCPGYVSVLKHIEVAVGSNSYFPVYIYLRSVNESAPSKHPYAGLKLTPELAKEIDKGLELMHKQQFENAKVHFAKADKILPGSSDIAYLQGTAQLGLSHKEAARQDFQRAVTLDPTNGKALLSLGELQLQSGDTTIAIATLTQAYAANGAGWRTQYLLASAYVRAGNLSQAEKFATHAAKLGNAVSPAPLLLLGEIQAATGKWADATTSWQLLILDFPAATEAGEARKKIAEATGRSNDLSAQSASQSPLLMKLPLPNVLEDTSWAPADIDSKEYPVAPAVSCDTNVILFQAMDRLKSQLGNLEKFGATEHIEHQEIDKHGVPGTPKFHDFYYLVFVVPDKDSVLVEENRDGGISVTDFPTPLATTGLNSLGINVLLPGYRDGFNYQCEGLANLRGDAAWQLRFEEKKDANMELRRWNRNGKLYGIPLKGRFWISSTSYDLLRIETDLREPVAELELSRDHLEVDYGPVNFLNGKSQLWLPWNAEMYMELHGRRYHHKHLLSNYMLFGVDTSNKIGKPKDIDPKSSADPQPPPQGQPLRDSSPL